jgi:serine/threonine protein kinase
MPSPALRQELWWICYLATGVDMVDGTPFGRYEFVELLGRGGMGEVWRAHDTATDRIVAIKVLPPELANDAVFQQRFRREARAAAQLNEPHVIPIHGYGEIDGRLYVDMRLIEGRDLETILRAGPLAPARAVTIVEQIAQALHAAHRVRLVHRDVKPSNILVNEFDFAYLIDFGIARGADETRLTNTAAMIGTYQYMAPERIDGGDVDARADIYALACVLYECLTGAQPYPGDSVPSQIAGHMLRPPPRPSIARRGVPANFDAVIAKGMAKDPNERYRTTLELAKAARSAVTAPMPQPPRPPPERPAPATVTSAYPPSAAPVVPTPPPPPAPSPPAKGARQRTGRAAKVALGLAAVLALAVVAVMVGAFVRSTSDGGDTTESTRTSSRATNVPIADEPLTTPSTLPGTPTTTTSAFPTSLVGKWSGPVSGDQSGFDVVADITADKPLTADVTYPQLNCAGTWQENGPAGNGVRFITEKITQGTCVPSEVTLTPQNDGTVLYKSVYFSTSQQRDFTIRATMRRS